MKEIYKENKSKILIIVLVTLLMIVGLTFAYFAAESTDGASTKLNVEIEEVPVLVFSEDNELTLVADSSNFSLGFGDVSVSANPTASLSYDGEISTEYNVYLEVDSSLIYTTDEKTPELILVIKDENGDFITDISGLTYIEYSDEVKGFDITTETGYFTVKTNIEISTTETKYDTVHEWTYSLHFINLETSQNDNIGNYASATLVMQQEQIVEKFLLSDKILMNEDAGFESSKLAINYIETKGTPNFNSVETEDAGLYLTVDNDGDSYYFRGATEDNYVEFAGMLWRIIRIDGQGNIKLMLFNEDVESEVYQSINENSWYNYNDNLSFYHVGYMYTESEPDGLTTDSVVKTAVDEWYEENLANSYSEYISTTAIYCADRTMYVQSGISGSYEYASITYNSIYNYTYYYGAATRLFTSNLSDVNPNLICPTEVDSFTVDNTEDGNGALDYGIALITADEVAFAGANVGVSNESYYLNIDSGLSYGGFWTMTPANSNNVFNVYSGGMLSYRFSNDAFVIYPTISLNYNVVYSSGDGSISNPYTIEM